MMSDWSDEEAARLSNLDRDTREESQWVCDQIASALRSAFQRGKVEGMRDAVEKIDEYLEGTSTVGKAAMLAAIAANINACATALEQENKD
jgi:hypothetical protein